MPRKESLDRMQSSGGGRGTSGRSVECGMVATDGGEGSTCASESRSNESVGGRVGLGAVLHSGWGRRIGRNVGITAGCGSIFGGVLAIVHDAPSVAHYAFRTALSWGVMSTPFFVLREIMSSARYESLASAASEAATTTTAGEGNRRGRLSLVDGLKDSGAAGLLTGYFGALWVHGPKFGKLVQWAGLGTVGAVVGDLGVRAVGKVVKMWRRRKKATQIAGDDGVRGGKDSWEWPVWFPVLKDIDVEYQELLKRKAIIEAELEEERRRIRVLLQELERKEQLAAARQKIPKAVPSSPVTDISMGDSEED